MREQLIPVDRIARVGVRERTFDLAGDVGVERRDARGVIRAALHEIAFDAIDRVQRSPVLGIARIDVARRIVGRVVRTEAARDRLDQRRAAATARAFDRIDGEEVVAVDDGAGKAVGRRAFGQRTAGALLAARRRDRPAVVLQEEHDRSLDQAGEVARLVKVAFARRAVAEVHQHHGVLRLSRQAPRETDRVRQLRGDRDLDRQDVHAVGDRAARRIPLEIADEVGERVAVPQQRRQLAVLRNDPVAGGVERPGGADDGRLLAADLRKRSETPLPLQARALRVECAAQLHQPQRCEDVIVVERRCGAGSERAGRIEDVHHPPYPVQPPST